MMRDRSWLISAWTVGRDELWLRCSRGYNYLHSKVSDDMMRNQGSQKFEEGMEVRIEVDLR